MAWLEHITHTGIYENSQSGCFEAWAVDPAGGGKRLVTTCSTCAPPGAYAFWLHEVCTPQLRQADPSFAVTRAA